MQMTRVGNAHDGNQMDIEPITLTCVKTNMGKSRGSPWHMDDEMITTSPSQLWWYINDDNDIRETQTHRMCMKKYDQLNDVISHCEVLKT